MGKYLRDFTIKAGGSTVTSVLSKELSKVAGRHSNFERYFDCQTRTLKYWGILCIQMGFKGNSENSRKYSRT
jgi:hypothetical protein